RVLPRDVRPQDDVQPLEDPQDVDREFRRRPMADLAGDFVNAIETSHEIAVFVLRKCPLSLGSDSAGCHCPVLQRPPVGEVSWSKNRADRVDSAAPSVTDREAPWPADGARAARSPMTCSDCEVRDADLAGGPPNPLHQLDTPPPCACRRPRD